MAAYEAFLGIILTALERTITFIIKEKWWLSCWPREKNSFESTEIDTQERFMIHCFWLHFLRFEWTFHFIEFTDFKSISPSQRSTAFPKKLKILIATQKYMSLKMSSCISISVLGLIVLHC